jgi:hypothetical protein
MALIVNDRVLETCSTSGLVDFTLTGAVTGYQRFSAIGNGNTTYYAAYVIGSNDWEVGIGTVGTSSLTRDTILSSSTGSKVNFAGNPVIWCDLPSSKALFTDSNGNASATNFLTGFTSVAASGTQIVLTSASNPSYVVTGSGGQTIKLPDATTLANGTTFDFNNNQSSGAITVNNNSNTLVASIPSGGYVSIVLLSNATAAGSWDRHDQAPSNVSWSTNTFDYPGSITSATWNGSTVAVNRGGTGQTTFTAGQVLYGNGTSGLSTSSNITTDGTNFTVGGKITQVSGASTPYVLFSTGIPFIIVSSGTMGNNGALTIVGAVSSIYPNAYVYLPVNAISSGSAAGYYFARFSSTTVATVYNNVYTPGSGVPTIPASPTAFVTTGPGVYTQVASPANPFSISVPANALTLNGKIEIDAYSTQTTAASYMGLFIGSLYLQSNASTTWQSTKWKASGRGVTNGLFANIEFTSATYNSQFSSGTDSIASNITIALSLKSITVATTSVAVESFIIKVFP